MRLNTLHAATALATLSLSACTTAQTGSARISSQLKAEIPAGQSFHVVPADGVTVGPYFARYSKLVADHLERRGFRAAATPQNADMIVSLGYEIDAFRFRSSASGSAMRDFSRSHGVNSHNAATMPQGMTYGAPINSFYRGKVPRASSRSARSLAFKSTVDMQIVRRANDVRLFQGQAATRYAERDLEILVPSLIDAMFERFPVPRRAIASSEG